MMAIDFLGAGEILGAMITPALLISASGTLTLSTSNRLGRVVDRIRKLTTEAENLPADSDLEELVEKRACDCRSGRLDVAAASAPATRRYHALLGDRPARWRQPHGRPVGFYQLGARLDSGRVRTVGEFLLLIAAGMLVRKAQLAVRGTFHELDHIRKVVERKTTARATVR